jgi:hypothetical protein
MKSQIFTLLLLIIGAYFFQPTHQYQLSKRELTEYDLTGFIVGTCSATKTDMLIQNLCDQTLQSALMGTFPFLTYYCQTIGAGMTFCDNVNRYTVTNRNGNAKRFVYRRFVRSLDEDKKIHHKKQEMNTETDLEQKLVMQICIIKTKKSSVDMNQFCNRQLQQVQQGRYPEITRLCKSYPWIDYCQHIQSYLSKSLSEHSIPANINPSLVSSLVSKPSDIESIIDQENINNEKQELSSS